MVISGLNLGLDVTRKKNHHDIDPNNYNGYQALFKGIDKVRQNRAKLPRKYAPPIATAEVS